VFERQVIRPGRMWLRQEEGEEKERGMGDKLNA
jgi:hypothetical protein